MSVSKSRAEVPWLLLTFTLPVRRASQRVEVWRNLQRYGSVPLGNSGYLLPNSPVNRERFEWLGQAVRKYAGEASVVSVQSIDNLSTPQLVARFSDARIRDYQELIREVLKMSTVNPHKRTSGRMSRLRERFREIVDIDFFDSPLQKRVEDLLARADRPPAAKERGATLRPIDYVGRLWVARPRPGIAGQLHEVKGRIKGKVGHLTKDSDPEAEGIGEKIAGKVWKKIGQLEKVIENP